MEDGKQLQILRDNMPLGVIGKGNSAPVSSAMLDPRAGLSGCSRTFSSAGRRAT